MVYYSLLPLIQLSPSSLFVCVHDRLACDFNKIKGIQRE
jgi:hypothetical protein